MSLNGGGETKERGFCSSLVRFWTLVATFNSAAVPTYLGLLALWLLIFFFLPSLHGWEKQSSRK